MTLVNNVIAGRDQRIADLAYRMWEEDGRPEGRAEAHWLRAAVLGANDGLISTASLVVGVAAASNDRTGVLVAGIAGLTAGALSMAAGEYVSVSSYKAQRSLLESLASSTWWSFASITPLLMLVSRGFLAGLVAKLPNILPVVVIFGAMGWMGINIDIGSMMAASAMTTPILPAVTPNSDVVSSTACTQ